MRRAVAAGSVAAVGLTVAACGGGGSGGSGTATTLSKAQSAAYCDQARQVQQATVALTSNPDGLNNAFATFDKLAAVAPSQIQSSVQTLRAFYNRILSALGTTRPSQNPNALTNAVGSAAKGHESQLQAAGQRVTDFTKRNCGIDLSPSSSGSTTSTTR